MTPRVSVVIPVRQDAARLRLCLDALARQDRTAPDFEAVVVDNGSEDQPDRVAAAYPFARFAEEPRPGASAARNRGLALSCGEVVAFTDADCIPRPDWLEAGLRELAVDGTAGLAAGRVEVFPRDARRPSAVELFDMAHTFNQRLFVERWHFGATANLFVTRRVAESLGGFNEAIPYYGEDVDFGQRAWAAGWPLRYAEQAVVRHPARTAWSSLADRHRRMVRAAAAGSAWNPRRLLLDLYYDWPDGAAIAASLRHPPAPGRGAGVRLASVTLAVRLMRIGFRLGAFVSRRAP